MQGPARSRSCRARSRRWRPLGSCPITPAAESSPGHAQFIDPEAHMLKLLRVRNLLAVAAIVFAMGAAYNAMHTTQGVMGVAKGERPLPSEQFRAPIAKLEAHLFAPAPLTMEERIALAESFDE